MRKFLADSKMFEFDKFYRECQKNNRPFIKAKKNPQDNNYLVQLDLLTCDHTLTNDNQNEIKRLFDKEKIFLNENNLHSVFKGYNVDKEFVWYDGILPERLNVFCEKLYDLSVN